MKNRTALFLILTFTINFSMVAFYKLLGFSSDDKTGMTVLGLLYMFVPAICAVIVEKLFNKGSLKKELLISFKINRWFFVAWLLPLVLAIGSIGVSLLLPDVGYSFDIGNTSLKNILTPQEMEQVKVQAESLPIHPFWLAVVQGLIAGVTINAVAGFGEELGWRGFLLKSFKEMSFVKVALVIGLIWGVWHAPLILMGLNYPEHPKVGVFQMILFCLLLTPLLLYVTIKSKSVIAAALMHGTINGTAGLPLLVLNGGNDLTVGLTGLAGLIFIIIILILFFIYDTYIVKEKIMTCKISDHLYDDTGNRLTLTVSE